MIKAETFYQAVCDAGGCEAALPSPDYDVSHTTMAGLREELAETRGINDDETWKIVGSKTFCPRHWPGNIDCTTCGGGGSYFRHPDAATFAEKEFGECERCAGRGYLVATSVDARTGKEA